MSVKPFPRRTLQSLALAALLSVQLLAFAQAQPSTPAATPGPAVSTAPSEQPTAPQAPAAQTEPGAAAPTPTPTPTPAPATATDSSGAAAQPAAPADATAPAAPTAGDTRGLDEETQDLKKDVVDLNRDLFVLEEELLFPANTQVAVFVSMDVGDFFALDSVTSRSTKEVSNYLYTPREVDGASQGRGAPAVRRQSQGRRARARGILQRQGPATSATTGAARRSSSRRASAPNTSSSRSPTSSARQQPEFEIKDWE